jgi:hypothetical protein
MYKGSAINTSPCTPTFNDLLCFIPFTEKTTQFFYGQNSNQVEAQSLSNLVRYATNIHYVSEYGVYYCVIPSQKWHVLPELKDIYFHYGGTQLSISDLKNKSIHTICLDHNGDRLP